MGDVCPLGLAEPRPVYLDALLNPYNQVSPAAGYLNSAVQISIDLLAEGTQGDWVDFLLKVFYSRFRSFG